MFVFSLRNRQQAMRETAASSSAAAQRSSWGVSTTSPQPVERILSRSSKQKMATATEFHSFDSYRRRLFFCCQRKTTGGAAIVQWIRLRLPSCHPGFESQAHHLSFYQFIFELYHMEKTKLNMPTQHYWRYIVVIDRILEHLLLTGRLMVVPY